VDNTRPRERLIAAAQALFYPAGIGAVGVNRLIEHAGVGQMSLWRTFGSKRGLVEAWLGELDQRLLGEVRCAVESEASPRERIEALFDVYAGRTEKPGFLGCPLVKATAEPEAGTPTAREIALDHKQAVRAMFAALATEAGAAQPELLATQLLCLLEGALVVADLRVAEAPVVAARAAALVLLDQNLASRPNSTGKTLTPKGG
jgi:AcrR family transcriptional regulator